MISSRVGEYSMVPGGRGAEYTRCSNRSQDPRPGGVQLASIRCTITMFAGPRGDQRGIKREPACVWTVTLLRGGRSGAPGGPREVVFGSDSGPGGAESHPKSSATTLVV